MDYTVAGDFALVLSSSNIFYAIALFGMRPYQISDTRQQFSDRIYFVSRVATCGGAAFACIIFCFFNDYTRIQNICLLVFMIYRVTEAGMDVLHGMMQSACRMDIVAKSLIIRGVAALMLFCAALLIFRALLPALGIMALFSVTWLILFEYRQARKVSKNRLVSKEKVRIQELRKLLTACLPLLIGNLVYSLILFVPRYFVEGIYGTDALGVYASISAPALIIPMLATYIYTPYMPAISEYFLQRKKKQLSRLTLKLILVVAIMGVVLLTAGYLFGEWGLVLLFGESIREYSYMLIPILLGVICTAFVYFFNAVIISIRKNSIVLASSGAAVIICFALSYFLVKGSINGASYSLIAIQFAQALILFSGYLLSLKRAKAERSLNV